MQTVSQNEMRLRSILLCIADLFLFFLYCSVLMARHFGESFHSSQCHGMCDICEKFQPPALAAGADPPITAFVPPVVISRDLSEAALQVCEYVLATNEGKSGGDKTGGKRKRASKSVGTITQKQLTDECRKRNSSVSRKRHSSHVILQCRPCAFADVCCVLCVCLDRSS